jgi:hypothetical protein
VNALIVAGATVIAGGLSVGVAFADGSPAAGHASDGSLALAATTAPTTTTTAVPVPTTTAPPTTTTVPVTTTTASPPPWAAASSGNSVSGHDGSLSATLTASTAKGQVGSPITFTVTVSDSASAGPEGMQWIRYGDGTTQPATGFAAHCTAGTVPTLAASTSDQQHAFASPGGYTITVLVQAPCSGETVTLNLPVAVS